MSKACKIKFSVPLLFELIGLKNTDGLTVYAAVVDQENKDVVALYLHGEHPDLPELNIGDNVPEAIVECERINARLIVLD